MITTPFTYLEIPFLVIVVRMSMHGRPLLVIDCPPLAPYPPPPLPTAPTVHVTCFQRRHYNISYMSDTHSKYCTYKVLDGRKMLSLPVMPYSPLS
jgi:hypothetical protein